MPLLIDPNATPSDYDAVRAALNVSLDRNTLPDSVIALVIYAPKAEADVRAIYSDADTRPPDEFAHLKAAAIYLAASYIAVALPSILRETFPQYSYQAAEVDPFALSAALEARASEELAAVPSPVVTTADAIPTFFTVASGSRGDLSESPPPVVVWSSN